MLLFLSSCSCEKQSQTSQENNVSEESEVVVRNGMECAVEYEMYGWKSEGELPLPTIFPAEEGFIAITIEVNSSGKVIDAKLSLASMEDDEAVKSAIKAAKKSRFTPNSDTPLLDDEKTIFYLFSLAK